MTIPRALVTDVMGEEVKEAAAQVLEKGLLRKIATGNGARYEITEAGWRFLKDYQEIQAELGNGKLDPANDHMPVEGSSAQAYLPQRAELLEFLKDQRRLQMQYELLKPDITIVIPTMNEAKSIGNILQQIRRYLEHSHEVIVVDASDDETAVVAGEFGAKVVKQVGSGKGTALRQAFCGLEGDIIVMMDGDGSMRAEEIPGLVSALVSGADVAKGSRFLRSGGSDDLSLIRTIGNFFFVTLVNLFWSADYTDLCYGFITFKREALERLKPYLKSKEFQIETEICIMAKKLGMRVVELPSIELRRVHGESKLSGIRDSLRIFSVILHERFSRL